jgi:hypothetical protein
MKPRPLYDALLTLYTWPDHATNCSMTKGGRYYACTCRVGRTVKMFVKAVEDAR